METIIAEKFEAIVKLNVSNSRMKDFYDIFYLANHSTFEQKKLTKAIENTFRRRQTDLQDREAIFEEKFRSSSERQRQWDAFLQRNGLDNGPIFESVIALLDGFLNTLFNKGQFDLSWSPDKQKWIKTEKTKSGKGMGNRDRER